MTNKTIGQNDKSIKKIYRFQFSFEQTSISYFKHQSLYLQNCTNKHLACMTVFKSSYKYFL